MKNIFVLLCLLLPGGIIAQSVEVLYISTPGNDSKNSASVPKIDTALLAAISDTMFQQGNPNYIWADLVKDGYPFHEYYGLTFVTIDIFARPGKLSNSMPAQQQQQYAAKWKLFAKHIGQPLMDSSYTVYLQEGMNYQDILNAKSKFRANDQANLFRMGLTSTGKLRLYKEFLNDKLSGPNFPIDFSFSDKGYYVHGKLLSADLEAKYKQILKEEFGFSGLYSWQTSPETDNILGDRIDELAAKINAIK